MEKITNFTDLIAWKEGHSLVLAVYDLTEKFPQRETFSLTDQMRRAVVSITSNVAEGFSRRSSKEKVQFYRISQASLTELQNQLIISKDLKYLDKNLFDKIIDKTAIVQKLINGLIKSADRIS